MANLEDNKAVCRSFYEHLGRREFAAALDLVADDVDWWVQGDVPVSGQHHGKAAVDALLEPLRVGVAGNIEFVVGEVTAEGERVAFELKSSATLVTGKPYRSTYHFLFWVRNGKIVRAKEYLDTKALADLLGTHATS
jgi:ketosteroid isomerase-like protein